MQAIKRIATSFSAKNAVERQLFKEQNRREVLALYRDILKAVSRSIPRKLERESALAEFRFIFRDLQFEEDVDQVNEVKMVLYTVLDRIDNGLYPPFPQTLRV